MLKHGIATVAWDAKADNLILACAGGELITLPASGGNPTRTLRLDRDLRDVVWDGTWLYVTRFRSAEVTGVPIAVVTPAT